MKWNANVNKQSINQSNIYRFYRHFTICSLVLTIIDQKKREKLNKYIKWQRKNGQRKEK